MMLAFRGYCKHIKGGEIHYTYLGPSPTKPGYDQYQLRLRLFISCQSTTGQLETTVVMGIYRNSDNYLVQDVPANLTESELINLTKPSPCIVHPSPVCYWIREFTTIVELQKDSAGVYGYFPALLPDRQYPQYQSQCKCRRLLFLRNSGNQFYRIQWHQFKS